MNSVTLYSNGTAVIRKEYEFEDAQPLRITIPVRKSDLDDVVSSISAFGDATIVEPPTYTPTNAQETTLTLNPASVLKDLATKLSGADVVVDAGTNYRGRLLGLHQFRREVDGKVVEQIRLMILTEKGVQQVEETSVTAIRFTDAMIQAEIDKALRSSLGQVKPDSSMVEMTLQPNAATAKAMVTYATPVAAWKIRYQLRLSGQETELEGQAVVDNDTDDDWTETLITVITGEPITFSTDLAEIRRPTRSRVNIVADHATGAVTAEPPEGAEIAEGFQRLHSRIPARAGMARYEMPMPPAAQVQAEVRESGDFSVFASPNPVTIGAKRSAIIPLFRTAVGDGQTVLFYREQDDARRPFRAIRLKNRTAHSLGRGVCEVFVDGDFQGKCVLEPTKTDEEVLLIYAKETGVRIFKETSVPESRRMAIKISEGSVYGEDSYRRETRYRVQSSQSDAFTLEIEHPRTVRDAQLSITVSLGKYEVTDIPSGQRIRVALPPKECLLITVQEEWIRKQDFVLGSSWLQNDVISFTDPPAPSKDIEKCIELQENIDALKGELKQQELAAETIAQEQERLMKLIPSGHGEQANAWRTDLADAEKELRNIKRSEIPRLKGQLREAERALRKALKRLQYEWKNEAGTESQQ